MGIQYGKDLSEQSLRYLSSTENPLDRLLKGWSEIDVATHDDAALDEYQRIKKWKEQYLSSKLPDSKDWRQFENDKEMLTKIDHLIAELVSICCDMIERRDKTPK